MSSLTLTELLALRDPKFGEVGFTGSRGATGFTGSQGIQGDTGFTGSQGLPVNLTSGIGISGGGLLDQDRELSADLATQGEAESGTDNSKLMTPLRTSQAQSARHATVAEIKGFSGTEKVPTTEGFATAAALTSPSGASDLIPDWTEFISANWVLTGNRTLQNPTNVTPGTTRIIRAVSNDSTERTVSFGSNYVGDLNGGPVTDDEPLLYMLYASSSSEIWVSALRYNK